MELKIRLPFVPRAKTSASANARKQGEGARIVQTFALAGTLFLIPLGISAYNYVETALKDIAFADAERVGMDYLRPAQEVLGLMQRHAALSRAALAGETQSAARLAETASAIRVAMEGVERADQSHQGSLGVMDAWKKIKKDWGQLASRGQTMTEADNVAAHEKLAQDVTSFIQDVGDKSNLILDPDLDTYYLMDITVLRLPHLSDAMGRAVSIGVAGAATKSLTPEQKLGLGVFAQLEDREGIQQSLDRAFKATPALREKLETPAAEALKAVEALQNSVRKLFLQGEVAVTGAQGWLQLADPLLGAHLPFAAAAETELDNLLLARINKLQRSLYINLSIIAVAATLAIALLVVLARRSAKQVQQVADENERNQAAVMRFMTELADVADGNLKTKVTVTEEITGTIADMVNHTIEQLGQLVVRINQAAEQVASSSAEARTVAEQNLSVTEQQASEVQNSSETVGLMARSILEVSSSATRSADVARKSIATAEQGTVAVKHTIQGMNGLREQIQETAKRIKRLGESSQEIGEIVNLLSEITEQTNVLALNAAIQAAAAGEAGKGFSVVAEEVQRLAERSAEATRQIGAIINTIQTDTKDTISAMEKSTQSVVDGARLSDDAGCALGEIERVTLELAELIQNIAVTSQQQSEVAGEVGNKMRRVLDLTDNARVGTKKTASSVNHLSELAEQLKVSVAGFKV
jgi:methyl-accepting chemotaxis protein